MIIMTVRRALCLLTMTAVQPTRSDGWIDIDPETPHCLRMVYRFRVEDSHLNLRAVHGWCEPVSADGTRAAAAAQDGTDGQGLHVPSGVYVARLRAGDRVRYVKLVRLVG